MSKKLYKQHMEWWCHLENLLELLLAKNFDGDNVEEGRELLKTHRNSSIN